MSDASKMETKAIQLKRHVTYIIASASGDFHSARCDDCSWESPEFDGRRYLAEMSADEHQRAMMERIEG